ncbi:hypothetical protein BGZ60DRAFT_121417 [Tricladium varicosporioides]|nr:hypothetical protein BGZ60DRAFT_121417 [Hymenoscyphus varicosporioides]
MFAILLDSNQSGAKTDDALVKLLSFYGINDVAKLDSKTGLLSSYSKNGSEVSGVQSDQYYDTHLEVLLVRPLPEISNLAIRRLTLSSVRLPSCVAVWDSPAQTILMAARIPWPNLRPGLLQQNASPEKLIRTLKGDDSVTSYTIHEFTSIDSLRMGGSFSKIGIGRHFIKSARGRGAAKLRNEIAFYQSLPSELRTHYPKLLFAENGEQEALMGTEYKDDPSIRDLLLNLQITPADAVRLLRPVLNHEYHQAFRTSQQQTPANYLHDYHFHRIWRRIAMTIELDPTFNRFITATWLVVNGKRLPNIPGMLLRLEEDEKIATRLDPGGVSPFIHADMHLGNILSDVDGEHFWFVDPRGYPLCDIYYDLGKLELSYNSKYDLLHEGRHAVSYEFGDDTAVINYAFTPTALTNIYDELNQLMKPVIQELLSAEGNGEEVEMRVRFNEAMHWCCLMPFHLHHKQHPSLSIPMYAIGAQLLAEVLIKLDVNVEECAKLQSAGLKRLSIKGAIPWRFDG